MKLQLKVFSGSWCATEKRKQIQKPKGHCKSFVLCYKSNSLLPLSITAVRKTGIKELCKNKGLGFFCFQEQIY